MERYVLNTTKETVDTIFGVTSNSDAWLEPTFNAAKGHSLPIIFSSKREIFLESAIWGISSNGNSIAFMPIDEVLDNEKYVRQLKSNACIIPISGFYKWKVSVKDPLPFFVRLHTRELLGIAGFFFKNEDARNTFCCITKPANVLIKPLDESMPCILDPENYLAWLYGEAPDLLRKGFDGFSIVSEMTVFRVPDLVNDLSKNSPELLQPIPKLREDE